MRMIDADSLESKLPAHSNDSDHVMTRNFAVESFRALIKAEPTVTPLPVYEKGILLDRAVRYDLQNAFPKALLNLRLELIAYPARIAGALHLRQRRCARMGRRPGQILLYPANSAH